MHKIKILLIEDDELACELIYNFLTECGFEVTPLFTATDGISYIRNNPVDIVILDLNLPDFDGFEVLKHIRQYSTVPIIIASAYSDTQSKLFAFKFGANDYMVKPIDLEELEARIWVQLNKNNNILNTKKELFSRKGDTIYFEGKALHLTAIEFEIFSILLDNANQTVHRDTLVEQLSSISSHRSLDNHIKNIRKKIGDSGNKAKYLKTEYGIGYSLKI
ncbi:MAG: response regulator transcription factor [Sulfurimonas sp.]|jgi:DNA-binding response OmpR family regulator